MRPGRIALACVALSLAGLAGCAGSSAPAPRPAAPTASQAAPAATAPIPAGTLLLSEPFDRPGAGAFAAEEDERARYSFESGGYLIEVKAPETLVWALADGSYADISVSVDAELPPESGLAAGVIFHYQDERNFYLFQVSGEGYYTLELLAADRFTRLIDWTQSDAIGETANQLRVETRGDRITLFVNDQPLEETRDPSFTAGSVGLAASSFAEAGAAVRFDNLTVVQGETSGGKGLEDLARWPALHSLQAHIGRDAT